MIFSLGVFCTPHSLLFVADIYDGNLVGAYHKYLASVQTLRECGLSASNDFENIYQTPHLFCLLLLLFRGGVRACLIMNALCLIIYHLEILPERSRPASPLTSVRKVNFIIYNFWCAIVLLVLSEKFSSNAN